MSDHERIAGVFGPMLRQPDQRTCAPACLVVARMTLDPAYAAWVCAVACRFADEVLAQHRQVRLWPRALGTPPWEAARLLTAPGVTYRTRLARPRRGHGFEELRRGVRSGRPVLAYVGSRLLPRHVVLVLGESSGSLRVYDPATGTLRTVTRAAFAQRRLGLGGWHVPWFLVTPSARRTPA